MRHRFGSRRGNTVLEFTLVGIPLVFVLISIFEISRGMWMYHTLAHGVKTGVRYAAVHGQNCLTAPNACGATIATIAQVIVSNGAGLVPQGSGGPQLQLTFCAPPTQNLETCQAGASYPVHTCAGDACLSDNTAWPPAGANRVGFDDTEIVARYPFASAIALVWPGAHTVDVFPTYQLPASARERVEF